MALSSEWQFLLFAVGIYLFDSSLLLHCNEGVLFSARKNRWQVGFGSHRVRLRGKELFMPNPFTPHRPLFRLSWQFDQAALEKPNDWSARTKPYRGFAPFIYGVAVGLFILLPVGLLLKLNEIFLLAILALIYVQILAAIVLMWFKRRALGLNKTRFSMLAFESLVCPPLALNLVRKLSRFVSIKADLVSEANGLQAQTNWKHTQANLLIRLNEEIEEESTSSIRSTALLKRRTQLESLKGNHGR
jgi:hypothetical protein